MLKYTLPEELQKLINYIQNKLIKEFPINNITLNYILLAILDKHESDGYQVLSKLLMSTDLKDFKEYVSGLVLIDSNKDLSTGDDYSYSSDYYDIMDSKIDDNIVGSCRFLINCISKNKNIKDYLKKLGVTIEQLKTFVVDYHNNKISTQTKIKEKEKPIKKIDNNPHKKDLTYNNKRIIPSGNKIIEHKNKNLIKIASTGAYDNIIGYDDITNDIFECLSKYNRNVVALIGESGVGKTSIIEKLSKRIYDMDCPESFSNKFIVEIKDNISTYLIEELNNNGKYIVFIDDLERLFFNKDAETTNLVVINELFKSPNISTIFCMNESQYMKIIESKPSISRYITKIKINEPQGEELFNIIKESSKSICKYNNVEITDKIIEESIKLSKKYITNEKCPKSALNIIDYACSHVKLNIKDDVEIVKIKEQLDALNIEKNKILNSGSKEDFDKKDKLIREQINLEKELNKLKKINTNNNNKVELDDLYYVVSKLVHLPITKINEDERVKLKNLYNNITNYVIGQNESVELICQAMKRQRIGLSNPNKPLTFLMCGKSGVGKTYLAKRLAYEMFGDENEMVRLDMSEYGEKSSVTKLYGSSIGYVGYEEGGILTEAIKKKKNCVLLLDEIEKAHNDVYDVFLQIFDEGRLTDNKGCTIDFKNVIIIMTSNVGVKDISDKPQHIGFTHINNNNNNNDIIMKSIKNEFKPEFINRIDNICIFNDLTDDNIKTIIKNEILKIKEKLINIGYDLDNSFTNNKLINNIFGTLKNYNEYGARPVLRALQKHLEDPLTDYIIDNNPEIGYIFNYNDIYKKYKFENE